MAKRFAALLVALLVPVSLLADVAFTERQTVSRKLHKKESGKAADAKTQPGERDFGSLKLTDSSGLEYMINTNLTESADSFSSGSSNSAAASEANFTRAVPTTNSTGAAVSTTLTDAFDGYNALCIAVDGADGPCERNSTGFQFYNETGAAPTADATCGSRQYIFPVQTLFGQIQVQRKVFVPTDDAFIRWADVFTNTGATAITFKMITANNLGSDSNTKIITTSSGDNVAQTSDTWITSFQNAWTDMTHPNESDPRLGHVLQGAGAAIPVHAIFFVDGNDQPWWDYQMTLAPGQTRIILNYATGQGTKAGANNQAARLVGLPATTRACLSQTELSQVGNFVIPAAFVPPPSVPALSPWAVLVGAMFLALAGALAMRLRS